MVDADLAIRFGYHKPDTHRAAAHQAARSILWDAAKELNVLLPEGREKSLAITKLEEAMFWANAAIAREGKS